MTPNQPTRQKLLNPLRLLISRNNYKTIESNMSMEGNWGSLSYIEKFNTLEEASRKREYMEVDIHCYNTILELASLIPTGEIGSKELGLFSSNAANILSLFRLVHLDITQLKGLLHHLGQNAQNSPKTLDRCEVQINFFTIWFNTLGVQHEELLKRNPPVTSCN